MPMPRVERMYVITQHEITPALQAAIGAQLGHPRTPATQTECRQFVQQHGDQVLQALICPLLDRVVYA